MWPDCTYHFGSCDICRFFGGFEVCFILNSFISMWPVCTNHFRSCNFTGWFSFIFFAFGFDGVRIKMARSFLFLNCQYLLGYILIFGSLENGRYFLVVIFW